MVDDVDDMEYGGVILSEDMIASGAGVDSVEEADEVEIIFDTVTEIGNLDRLIDTRLRELTTASMLPVRNTLLRLCLTEQPLLKRLPKLDLPVLRDLLLHKNGIESLAGRPFDGCPQVQRLWLQSNRISRLEGLDALGDLRELWVQDNALESVHGVESLGSLQVLNVAANPLGDLREVHRVGHLDSLRSVSFEDPHYGQCPLCLAEGYRAFVLASLPNLRSLDGDAVDEEDRADAREDLASRARRFADSAAAIAREHQVAQEKIALQRAKATSAAAEGKERLGAAFARLEAAVGAGRDRVLAEEKRLREARGQAVRVFREEIEQLAEQHAKWVAERDEKERVLLEREQGLLRWRASALTATQALRTSFPDAHEIGSHAPEARALAAKVQSGVIGSQAFVLRTVRVPAPLRDGIRAGGGGKRVWLLAPPHSLATWARGSQTPTPTPILQFSSASLAIRTASALSHEHFAVSQPKHAAVPLDDTESMEEADKKDGIDSTWAISSTVQLYLLQARLPAPTDGEEEEGGEGEEGGKGIVDGEGGGEFSSATEPITSVRFNDLIDHLNSSSPSSSSTSPRTTWSISTPVEDSGTCTFLPPSPPPSYAFPELAAVIHTPHLPHTPPTTESTIPSDLRSSISPHAADPSKLYPAASSALRDLLRTSTTPSAPPTTESDLTALLSSSTASPAAVLTAFLRQVDAAVAKHAKAVWTEADPEGAAALSDADAEYARLSNDIVRLRAAIEAQKREQEAGLRAARAATLGSGED